jgi:hypothetical protein
MTDDVDDHTLDRFLEVYLLWQFGSVLFCESAGDSVSRCIIPWAQRITDAPLEHMPQICWGSTILAATYRGLCSAMTRLASREAILLGCPLLLQMWIHERFDIGREMNRISTDGNSTLCNSVVVPGGLPRAIPCLRNTKNPYKKKTNRVQHLFITLIRVHLFGTCRVQVEQD